MSNKNIYEIRICEACGHEAKGHTNTIKHEIPKCKSCNKYHCHTYHYTGCYILRCVMCGKIQCRECNQKTETGYSKVYCSDACCDSAENNPWKYMPS
jgi:hypothetical protein